MNKIKDLLLLDISEDIKDVIDLEDRSEAEIQFEIENYIVTNKISKYISDFTASYQGNIKETGVWLSGFYGSGKSYFGKMLGYVLENKLISGTLFRDRFIQRLAGISNQSLLENSIRGLDVYDTKVVFLDIAKQNTKNGFAWTLFKNFLRTLGFLDDVFGYMEYGLFLDGKYEQFLSEVKNISNDSWYNIRKNPIQVPQTVRKALSNSIYSGKDYEETKDYLSQRITSYDAAKFKEELSHYLEKYPDQRIVFIIDEVSEAISQKKIDLLELEGISEALSGIPAGKVWTIAIAQEKLEDVIKNANVSIKELGKVIDRFKTPIHLSSDEVDTVIRKRLLLKNDKAAEKLKNFYSDNSGLIIDSTSLNAKFHTKSENFEDFAIYYPFHKYQFGLLQNFLFSIHQKAKTGGTERGMIIATHTILKTVNEKNLFAFVTANNLAEGGQKILDSELERKFAMADRVLSDAQSSVNGASLLKTVYFLTESEQVSATAENITKLYLTNLDKYYDVKPEVEQALATLSEANLLLEKGGIYKITSDLEHKLIDEMRNINVELHYRKRELIVLLKKQPFIEKDMFRCFFENNPYQFYLTSVQGDELNSLQNKYIKIQIASPYTVELENRDQYIEKIKFETQGNMDTATLIPSMGNFLEIDKLIEEVYRYSVLEDRYKNDDDEKIRGIVKDFSFNKMNQIKALNNMIEAAYLNGTIVYHFEENNLNENNFSKIILEVQGKIIKNTYTDRLPLQLSEDIGNKILKESNQSKLKSYFSLKEFEFFDSDGNFIGERLRVVEKLVDSMKTIFIDGDELESQFSKPPCGYSYGTLLTVLAVLMRAGRLAVKYNGITHYNYKDEEILSLFSRSREFKKASFKAITSTLSLHQKQQIVDHLKELKARTVLDRQFSYSTNDIELVMMISELADHFTQKVVEREKMIPNFDNYFSDTMARTEFLRSYIGKVTDSNYKAKAEEFIDGYAQFKETIQQIQSVIVFIETSLTKVEKYNDFITHIVRELEKLGGKFQDNSIFSFQKEFKQKFKESIVHNFNELEKLYQKIKDEYHRLIKDEHKRMTQQHQELMSKAEVLHADISKVSASLNNNLITEINDIIYYAGKHTCNDLKIEFETSCQSCHFSLNEILTSNQNIGAKYSDLEMMKTKVRYPQQPGKEEKLPPKKINLKSEKGEFTVSKYKQILNNKLNQINSLNDDDIVIVE